MGQMLAIRRWIQPRIRITEPVDNNEYHTVTIDSKLKPIEIKTLENGFNPLPYKDVEQGWNEKVTVPSDKSGKTNYAMHTVTNGPCTQLNLTNAVLQAFLLAYNNHQDLVLSPDDMWLVVSLQFAEYINDHAEQLRSLFVEHSEGKKMLCVMESALSDENDCK
jgi:hypothetical protein